VVLDCEPGFRRTYRLWEEGKAPDVVIEVTSNSTRRQDEDDKPSLYAAMGVREYYLYDPTSDYLDPPLQGYRFVKQRPTLIRPNSAGALESRCLGVALRLEGAELVITDQNSGARLLTKAEFDETQRQAAEAKQQAAEAKQRRERAKRKQAEDDLRAAQDEIAKLRRQLGQEPPSE